MVKINPSSGLALLQLQQLVLVLVAVLAARDVAVHGQTLETGWDVTYVLDENGTLFAWGKLKAILGKEDDPVYSYGIGDEPSEMGNGLPQFQSKLARVTAVSSRPTCLVDGTAPPARAVQCWGSCWNSTCGHGRLGDYLVSIEDAPLTDLGSDATDRVISAKGALWGHMCTLFASGRVKCWGRNWSGQLGLGDVEDRGEDPGDMGDNLPFVDLGTGVKAVQVAVGSYITCAVLEGRRLIQCWGAYYFGQLGLGDNETRGDELGEMGDNLPALDMGDEIEDVQFGEFFGCALFAKTREVKCWGHNYKGSLGAPHEDNVVLADATLSAVSVGGRAAKLAVGKLHSCVILEGDAATVKCWGMNDYGQLGLGSDRSDTRGKVPSELPDVAYGVPGETAVEISCGRSHTCVRLAGGQVRCWGANHYGQLGHGARYSRWGQRPDHMGANLPDLLFRPTPLPPPTQPETGDSAAGVASAGFGAGLGAGVGIAAAVALAAVAYFRSKRSNTSAAAADDDTDADSAPPSAVFVQKAEDSNHTVD